MPPKNNSPKKSIKKIIDPALAIFTTLDDISQKLSVLIKQNLKIETMQDNTAKDKKSFDLPDILSPPSEPYDKVANILTSQPAPPDDPLSGVYQREYIYEVLKRKGKNVHLVNNGPGLLFAVATSDGITWTTETFILEGEHKIYDTLYELGLRSPTAGLTYRVSEREITNQASQQFSGSRFEERRDRKGVILFKDGYESPTLKFLASFVPPVPPGLGTVNRSTDTAYDGDFSLKLVTDPSVGAITEVQYNHPDFHSSKVGVQVRFATAISQSIIGLAIHHIMSNGFTHEGEITVTMAGELDVLQSDGIFHSSQTGFQVETALTGWNTLKLVIDLSTFKYVSASLNGVPVDLSNLDLFIAASGPNTEFIINLITLQFTGGGVATCYFDNYIFTEDET